MCACACAYACTNMLVYVHAIHTNVDSRQSVVVQNGYLRNQKAEDRAIAALFAAKDIPDSAVTMHDEQNLGFALVQSTQDAETWYDGSELVLLQL